MEIFIIVLAALFLLIVTAGIARFVKNENSPIIAARAILIDKRCDSYTHTDANGMMAIDETLYLMYQLDTGSTLEFTVSGRVYRDAVENEWGILTFQGTRFLKFESPGGVLEK